MADVNLQLVREFFELNLFRVLTNWQRDPWRQRAPEASGQLFVEHACPVPTRRPPTLLTAEELPLLERAVVEVRAWHGERFYPSVIESSPVLAQFVEEASLAVAREVFGDRPFATVLVVSELPASPGQRARAIRLLEAAGIEHVLEFPTILQDLLQKVSANVNYAASTTLQVLRLLKRYKLIRFHQLELPFPAEPPVSATAPVVETDPAPETADPAE